MVKKIKKPNKKSKTDLNKKNNKSISQKKSTNKKIDVNRIKTLKLETEHSIAMDFAVKTYKKFDKIIKSIVLFGSVAKRKSKLGSDIDVIIIIDDATIQWTTEVIDWYRLGLNEILQANPYKHNLHINTVKLTTWWEDLMRGDPVILNILRYGETLIDIAGFFDPLKILLNQGIIKPSPEAIYNCLKRSPMHIQRSKAAELGAIEGLYWSMVDSAHAALIAANIAPPSPEHIAHDLYEVFVNNNKLKKDFVKWYQELLELHKNITHGKITDLKGIEIDTWQDRTQQFLDKMIEIVKDLVER